MGVFMCYVLSYLGTRSKEPQVIIIGKQPRTPSWRRESQMASLIVDMIEKETFVVASQAITGRISYIV